MWNACGCSCTHWKPAAAAFSIRSAPSIPGAEAACTSTPDQIDRGAVHQLAVELLLALEVLVDERLRDPRSGGHVIDPDVLEAVLAEHLVGRVQDALAPLLGTQPPPWPLAPACTLIASNSHTVTGRASHACRQVQVAVP